MNQDQLILTNILGSELIGRVMEMLSILGDVLEVQSNGFRRIVASLELLQHALSKLGRHNALSVMTEFCSETVLGDLCRKAASFKACFKQLTETNAVIG